MTNPDETRHPEETDPDRAEVETSDTDSDPALGNGEEPDWSSEGGATPDGPATDLDD